MNLNDEDLGLHADVTPRPPEELTDVSFVRARARSDHAIKLNGPAQEVVKWSMAKHRRRVQDRIRKGTYNYEMCLEIDNDFRESVASLCGTTSFSSPDSPIDEPIGERPTRSQCTSRFLCAQGY
jgi:hypothetical protein